MTNLKQQSLKPGLTQQKPGQKANINKNQPNRRPKADLINRGGRRSYRNLLQEKRDQALKDYLRERRVKKGLIAPKRDKKRTVPVIPPKSLFLILKSQNKRVYDLKFIDYKNRNLLQEYIRFDGKILARRKTGLTTKQQRYLTKAIKTARILGFLPFVKKERGLFR